MTARPDYGSRVVREDSIRLDFQYAAGAVASAELAASRDRHRLLGSRCDPCQLVLSPARPLCPRCGHSVKTIVDVGPTGVVQTWTWVPGTGTFLLVKLDGADTALSHRLIETTTRPSSPTVAIGDRVRPVFDPAGLAGFEVIDE